MVMRWVLVVVGVNEGDVSGAVEVILASVTVAVVAAAADGCDGVVVVVMVVRVVV